MTEKINDKEALRLERIELLRVKLEEVFQKTSGRDYYDALTKVMKSRKLKNDIEAVTGLPWSLCDSHLNRCLPMVDDLLEMSDDVSQGLINLEALEAGKEGAIAQEVIDRKWA
jgi:hypothetical protein